MTKKWYKNIKIAELLNISLENFYFLNVKNYFVLEQ